MSQESQNYQQMLEKVESIVKDIATSDVDLDQMVEKVEEGYTLIQKMREKLTATKARIEDLHKKFEEPVSET
ncbi:MAG: exodeoxyribonuclease VII small subunit [Oligoflexus sp.]